MDDNRLIDSLAALVDRVAREENTTEKAARDIIAKKAGVSEQYIYQIIKRKQMTGEKLRVPGREAREKLSKAYPNWLDINNDTPNKLSEEAAHPYKMPPRHPRKLIQDLINLAEQIDDDGLNQIIGFCRAVTATHPLVKTNARSST